VRPVAEFVFSIGICEVIIIDTTYIYAYGPLVLKEARKNARMQNLMSFIIRFDDDQDLLIDPEEEDELREKINYAYNLNISFEAFHAFMEKNGRSINSVVLVASKLLNEGLSSNEVVEEHFYGNDRTTS